MFLSVIFDAISQMFSTVLFDNFTLADLFICLFAILLLVGLIKVFLNVAKKGL